MGGRVSPLGLSPDVGGVQFDSLDNGSRFAPCERPTELLIVQTADYAAVFDGVGPTELGSDDVIDFGTVWPA